MVIPLSLSSGALSILSKVLTSENPLRLNTIVMAAVRVVLPWSTCPIVPTFTCGLVRSNLLFAIVVPWEWLLFRADHRFGDALRRLGVMLEFHGVGGAALRQRAHRRRIAEHLAQRHLRLDRLAARQVFQAEDGAAAL